MKFRINYIIMLLLTAGALYPGELHPENNYSGLTYSISSGTSIINGFYKQYFNDGYNSTFNTYYSLPLSVCNPYFKGGISWHSYNMKTSKNSTLSQLGILGGFGISYTPFQYFDLLAGIDLHGEYSTLTAYNTSGSEHSIKPALSFNTGAMTYLGRGLGLMLTADYRRMQISDMNFSTVDISLGITYNYNSYLNELDRNTRSEKKLTLFNQGVSEFKKKNFETSKTLLKELYGMDKNYPGLDYYMRRVDEIEQEQATAETLIRQQNYLKAIPHLKECSLYIKDCELKLHEHRKALKGNVAGWETEGIKLYDDKNYKGCIELMERVLLVDPENQNANIYLPRAVKRQKAIDSLQGR